jgi:ATP-dependent NAD(P)H-hydrate dehydratase
MASLNFNPGPYQPWDDYKDIAVPRCILPLSNKSPKGSSGRIAVLGGCAVNTGGAYFAGMAALRTGADIIALYTEREAAIPLKCCSPDFSVQTVYSADTVHDWYISGVPASIDPMISTVISHLQREKIHCLVIGPDIGESKEVLIAIATIIYRVRSELSIYLVLDGDALSLFSEPNLRSLLELNEKTILTPNALEYERLMNLNHDSIESAVIVQKGFVDRIWCNGQVMYQCGEAGGAKRCRRMGDILTGTIATLVAWQSIRAEASEGEDDKFQVDLPLACWTACCIVKRATQQAFDVKKRAMIAQDVLDHLGPALEDMVRPTSLPDVDSAMDT